LGWANSSRKACWCSNSIASIVIKKKSFRHNGSATSHGCGAARHILSFASFPFPSPATMAGCATASAHSLFLELYTSSQPLLKRRKAQIKSILNFIQSVARSGNSDLSAAQ
jgi:hypothetical protein